MWTRWVVVAALSLPGCVAAPPPREAAAVDRAAPADDGLRFFVAGPGRFVLRNRATGETATVAYRRADGTYDPAAMATLTRLFASKDGAVRTPPVRLAELLGRVFQLAGERPLVLVSGYRSPAYNEGLRAAGRKAAGGSMHTEAMAADLAFAPAALRPLWLDVRALACGGAGYYGANGFLHVDVGQPRFWEAATSGVEKDLSAGNARLFARTEYDRYRAGDAVVVTLHALTAPPIAIARAASLVADDGRTVPVVLDAAAGVARDDAGCLVVADHDVRLRFDAPVGAGRGALHLTTCAPRPGRTPADVATNPLDVRG